MVVALTLHHRGPPVNPRQAVKRSFEEQGEAIAGWARRHGYKPRTVYAVLSGQLKCRRGKSHLIAVALGVKKRAKVK